MISFIIPTKNEEKVIEPVLKRLLEYKGQKEIIVSDGKSTDKTLEIAGRYAKLVEYTGKERQTIAMGRNAGAAIASGDFFVFLDADVFIPNPNEFFKKALSFFEKDEKLQALTVSLRVLPEFETLSDKVISILGNYYNFIINNWLGIGGGVGEFQMIRSAVFRQLGGYNEKLAAGEDHNLFQRLRKIGKTRFERSLVVYHTGRRAHAIGWPKLLWEWTINNIFVLLFKRSSSKEWKVIR